MKRLLSASVLLCISLLLYSSCSVQAPLIVPYAGPLFSHADSTLQEKVNTAIARAGLTSAIINQKLAVGIVDLSTEGDPQVAGLNVDLMMYAASLPKITILFAVFKKVQDGSLQYTPEVRQLAEQMMRLSSNSAATRLLEIVEPHYLSSLLLSEEYKFYDPRSSGGLWVGKPYSKGPAYQREPLLQLSHAATIRQILRFYYLLDTGMLVDQKHTRLMKEVMDKSLLSHKFEKALRMRKPKAFIYRKAGTWRTFHSDSALLVDNHSRYIIAALADDPDGASWLERIAHALDEVLEGS